MTSESEIGSTDSAALKTLRACLRLCGNCVTSCTSFFRGSDPAIGHSSTILQNRVKLRPVDLQIIGLTESLKIYYKKQQHFISPPSGGLKTVELGGVRARQCERVGRDCEGRLSGDACVSAW